MVKGNDLMKSRSFHLFALFALLLSLAGNLLTFTPVHAAGLVVNTSNDTIDTTPGNGICTDASGDCSLCAAIQEANALAGTDTITFAADYTITLAGSQLPAVTSVITIKGNGEANTIIQANANPNTASYRVFEVRSGGNLALDGLTVSNGNCIDACASSTDSGGCVFNSGTLTITNSNFSGNSANFGNDVGWLNGTAFPTWNGNSVLTAHVTNPSGMNGPFAALRSLKYGERVIVHMDGLQYIYEVRNSRLAHPYSTSYAFQSMQDHAYLTLITCQGYNPITESYLFRRVVRAVLISVENE